MSGSGLVTMLAAVCLALTLNSCSSLRGYRVVFADRDPILIKDGKRCSKLVAEFTGDVWREYYEKPCDVYLEYEVNKEKD